MGEAGAAFWIGEGAADFATQFVEKFDGMLILLFGILPIGFGVGLPRRAADDERDLRFVWTVVAVPAAEIRAIALQATVWTVSAKMAAPPLRPPMGPPNNPILRLFSDRCSGVSRFSSSTITFVKSGLGRPLLNRPALRAFSIVARGQRMNTST
jgi:hypothetical protein